MIEYDDDDADDADDHLPRGCEGSVKKKKVVNFKKEE